MSEFIPADIKHRERALNRSGSFIVQAPAGSGKTDLLVRRYLTLLSTVSAPEQILAITFTKKATAEMRTRILDALKHPDSNPTAGLDKIANAALANDKKQQWNLLQNPRRLRIKTIDSFCNELVRRMPWSARFGAPPELLDEPESLYYDAARNTLNQINQDSDWTQACARLLALVDADWNRALGLLADMLAKRDKWLRLLGDAKRETIEAMWDELLDSELQAVAAQLSEQHQQEMLALSAIAANNLIAGEIDSPLTKLNELKKFPGARHDDIGKWHCLLELFLTKSGGLRKTINKNHGFPPERKQDKSRMQSCLAGLSQLPDVVNGLAQIRLLPAEKLTDAQWQSLSALIKLLRLAVAELRLLFKAQNCADYIELTQRAESALGDSDAPTDLALIFDYQLRHILMDEFQDTSTAHIALLEKLTAGWQRGDGRTLFLVGDPMQSIYRFREAEVGNFLQVKTNGLGTIAVKPLVLTTNFRSTTKLINWFNEVFPVVLPRADNAVEGAVSYTRAHAKDDDRVSGGVYIHSHADAATGGADEAALIAETIQRILKNNKEHKIAVLVRARTHLVHIPAALRALNISYNAVDLEKLGERPAVRDLISITRALLQPAERIPWLALLRAPWCALTLDDINKLTDDRDCAIPNLLRDKQAIAKLSNAGQARVQHLQKCLTAAFAQRGRVSLRENVEAAWLALGAPATVQTAVALEDCQRYFELLDELEKRGVEINSTELAAAVESLWAYSGGESAVQLLTIHKAKGLEFDAVLLPGLARGGRGNTKTLLRWRKLPRQLLLAPMTQISGGEDQSHYQYLADLDKRQDAHELSRLLYVACTRAKQELHLFGAVKLKDAGEQEILAPRNNSLLGLLWQSDLARDGFSAPQNAPAPALNKIAAPMVLKKLPLAWSPPALPESVLLPTDLHQREDDGEIEFSWAGDIARAVGTVLHENLQRVDAIGWGKWCARAIDEEQIQRWQDALAMQGVAPKELPAAVEQLRDAVVAMRADEKAAWIFSSAHKHIKTEWQLAGVVDGEVQHIAIDRSFIADGVRWIIDFKSSRHLSAGVDEFLDREQMRYKPQMAKYAAVVKGLPDGAHQEIRLGLYFAALKGWREWAK